MLISPSKEKGQGLIEYALILTLLAVVVIVALQILGPVGVYVMRFIARYWMWGLLVLGFFLADLCARLIMDKLNRRY